MADRGMLPGRQERGRLDHYQVRRHDAWYWHITLSMLFHAFLAATAASCHPASSDTAAQKGIQRLWTTAGHPQRP